MDRRINIITKVSLMSSHLALPKGRHLDAAVHVMAYVGQKYNFRFYDTTYLDIGHSIFKKYDWSKCYWVAKKARTLNTSELSRKEVNIYMCLFWVVTVHEISYSQIKQWLLHICGQCLSAVTVATSVLALSLMP